MTDRASAIRFQSSDDFFITLSRRRFCSQMAKEAVRRWGFLKLLHFVVLLGQSVLNLAHAHVVQFLNEAVPLVDGAGAGNELVQIFVDLCVHVGVGDDIFRDLGEIENTVVQFGLVGRHVVEVIHVQVVEHIAGLFAVGGHIAVIVQTQQLLELGDAQLADGQTVFGIVAGRTGVDLFLGNGNLP